MQNVKPTHTDVIDLAAESAYRRTEAANAAGARACAALSARLQAEMTRIEAVMVKLQRMAAKPALTLV